MAKRTIPARIVSGSFNNEFVVKVIECMGLFCCLIGTAGSKQDARDQVFSGFLRLDFKIYRKIYRIIAKSLVLNVSLGDIAETKLSAESIDI